jgi:hypothetical protein
VYRGTTKTTVHCILHNGSEVITFGPNHYAQAKSTKHHIIPSTTLSVTIMTPVTPLRQATALPTSPSRTSFCYNAMFGTDTSDDLLKLCAELFSTNYGTWGPNASTVSKFTKHGQQSFASDRSPLLSSFSRATGQNVWQQTTNPMRIRPRENCPGDLLQSRATRWSCFCERLAFQWRHVYDAYVLTINRKLTSSQVSLDG